MKPVLVAALLAFVTSCAPTLQSSSVDYTAALADPARPAADRDRDATRKPAELLAFAEIGPGDRVVDFIMGGGYFTQILSGVVGPNGKVMAYQPAEFIQFNADYGRQQDEAVAGRANVVAMRDSLRTIAFGEPLDAIITVQNWHDLHLPVVPQGFARVMARRLFDALKPGGVLLVVDHVANSDPNFTAAQTLHRIDPAAARAEIESAGFRFEGELDVLRNPQDPRTANVFEPEIRGRTDQFIYKFRKPR